MIIGRDVIVIGASLGGVEALCKLARGFPSDLPASVLIMLHTSPKSPRFLAEIVGRYTPLPVSYGQQGEAVERGHVYFAPPDVHLVVTAPGNLILRHGEKVHFARPAADVLFRSAAELYGRRVIGVVLTGGDSDGAAGLRAIRAAGGVAVVQDPDEAPAPGMPLNALINASPDFRVSLDGMASLLIRLVTEQLQGPP
jgi:two-component system, chemotaxis family, protein-glutamate methylesterase/glutaminase